MTDGVMLMPGGGRQITGGGMDATLKVAHDRPSFASTFEVIVPPGYDVGAHVHTEGEEMFYVVEGQLDVLAFEPVDRSVKDWHEWESGSGEHFLRGGPGAFMYVPMDTPHAFANRSERPVKMFFQSSIEGGHENYFDELAFILEKSGGQPSQGEIEDLRRRYDIEQLTPMLRGAHG